MPVGVHVSSVGVHETPLSHQVAMPMGHGFDRPVGAIEVHGEVHVAHAGRNKIRRVGFTLGWVKSQRGGRGREGGVLHCDVERLVLAPKSQASPLRGGSRGFETDRPAR